MSKEASFGENATFSVLGWVVPVIAAFVCVPITVRGLGPDEYGLLALVTAIAGYLDLLDMGLGGALTRYLSHYRALGEGRPMRAIVRAALLWFTVAGLVVAVFLFFAAPWLARDVLDVSSQLLPTAEVAIRLSAANVVLGLALHVGIAIPTGFLRYDLSAAVTAVLGTATSVGPAVLVVLGYGIIAIVGFYVASNFMALLVYWHVGRRLLRSVPGDVGPGWHEIRRGVFSFAGTLAVNRIGTTIATQTNRVVIGAVQGTAAAGYYQVPSVLATRLYGLLSRIAQVLFPTGAAMLAREEHEELHALYLRSSRLMFLVNVSAAMPIAVYAYPLLKYWVNPLYADKGSVALSIFVATQSLNAAALAVGFLSWAAGRAGTNLVFAWANSALSLVTIYPLAVHFGVAGAAAAGLCGALTGPFFIYHVDRHILRISSLRVFRHCHLPTLAGATVVAVASALFLVPLAGSLLSTFVLLCVSGLLCMVLSGLLGAVTREDARSFRGLLQSISRRLLRR